MRIFLCDDSQPFCRVVELWLEEAPDLELVGVANDRAQALERLPDARADVVLLDTMASGDEPLRVDEVRAAAPGASVVVYSGHEPEAARRFVDGEPDAYLTKGADPQHLIDAIRAL
jgi:DNA-binding NarL/FixJ family response regulator